MEEISAATVRVALGLKNPTQAEWDQWMIEREFPGRSGPQPSIENKKNDLANYCRMNPTLQARTSGGSKDPIVSIN